MPDINTLQTNIKNNTKDMTLYSLFLGGLNVTSKALAQYDPLKTGYARIFFIKMPPFMKTILPEKTKQFKHLLEYGFVGIDGLQNISMEFEQVTGGYAGRQFEIPTVAKDETNSLTVKVYEQAGSPVREYTDMWISGIADPYTGLGHYHGALEIASAGLTYSQVNHSGEAIYVETDPTGRSNGIEYSCLLSNLVPKTTKMDHFNQEAGSHPIVQTDIEFTATRYQSPQINEIAKALVAKFKILRDYLSFNSQYTITDVANMTVPNISDWGTSGTT